MLPSELYKLIKPVRKAKGLTLQQLSDLAGTTDTAHLSRIENGKVGCTMETLDQIFQVLGIVIKTVRPVNFERWLTDNFTWNGAGWVSGIPSIVKSTDTLYQDYMRTFYPQLLEN